MIRGPKRMKSENRRAENNAAKGLIGSGPLSGSPDCGELSACYRGARFAPAEHVTFMLGWKDLKLCQNVRKLKGTGAKIESKRAI